jgi:serine/threonine-protein kinase
LPTPLPQLQCAAPLAGGFGKLWQGSPAVQQRLGCPLQAEQPLKIAEQPFERGSMLWVKSLDDNSGTVYVFFGMTAWQSVADTWREGDQESGGETPPPGLYEPIRGFGKVWRTNPRIRERIGWGTEHEAGPYDGAYQPFEHGIMLFSPVGLGRGKTLYVLYSDGNLERYDDPNRSNIANETGSPLCLVRHDCAEHRPA